MEYFILGFLSGVLIAEDLSFTPFLVNSFLFFCGLLFVVWVFWKGKAFRIFSLFFLGLVLSFFHFQFFAQKNEPGYITYYLEKDLTVFGRVVSDPEKSEDKTKIIVQIPNTKGRLLVYTSLYPEYQYGDELKIRGKLKKPPNFEDFKFEEYLKAQGVYGVINYPEIEKIKEGDGFLFKKMLFRLKHKLEESINRILPEPEASLAAGILLGERRALPQWLYDALVVVGLVHIIALSGYNVTIISKNLTLLFNRIFPPLSFYLSLIFIWLFVVMVGGGPTIVRAAIMGSVVLLGKKVGRARSMTRILLLTAFLMVLFNPFILKYDRGFQLSFLSTAGLVYFGSVLEKILRRWRFLSPVKEAGISSISAQLYALPLLLASFKKISFVALPVNLLVLPFMPLIMFFTFLTAISGLITPILGRLFGLIALLFLKYIIFISKYFAEIPKGFIEINRVNIFVAILYWIALAYLTKWLKRRQVA